MGKQMILEKMSIRNFKGCKELDIDFFHKTEISGKNEAGKTTINDAFNWLLFNKDSEGSTKFDIRPQDENGNSIDFIDIVVTLFLQINGKPVEIEKTQKQNWVKKRRKEDDESDTPIEPTFEGNVNSYVVNTIPKTEKEFKKYMDEIISEDIFKYVSNTNAFMSLKPLERRETLFKLVSDISDDEVLDTDVSLKNGLSDQLSKYTIEEITARDKKALTEYKKKNEEIPARIDEVSKKIVEVDYTETEIELAGLKKELENISEVGTEELQAREKISEIKGKILTEKSKMQEIEFNEKQAAEKDKKELSEKLSNAKNNAEKVLNHSIVTVNEKKYTESDILTKTEKLKKLQSEYQALKELKFDETKTICPVCQSKFAADKKEKMISDFETDKKTKMLEINKNGASVSAELKALKIELEDKESLILKEGIEYTELKAVVDEIQSQIDKLPKKDFDIMDCKEYVKISKVIEKLQKELSASEELLKNSDELKKEILEKKKNIQEKIEEANTVLNGKTHIENAKLRVEELKQEQKQLSQSISTVEKELYLLEKFSNARDNLLSYIINNHFKVVKWKLFERQVNGGTNKVCEPMVKGKAYTTALNSGHKILAELDIVNTLQKIYDCQVPVFLDNAERINKFNIPDIDCQLITLSVSDDKKLKVEEIN